MNPGNGAGLAPGISRADSDAGKVRTYTDGGSIVWLAGQTAKPHHRPPKRNYKLAARLFPSRNTDASRVTISPEPRKTPETITALACTG